MCYIKNKSVSDSVIVETSVYVTNVS